MCNHGTWFPFCLSPPVKRLQVTQHRVMSNCHTLKMKLALVTLLVFSLVVSSLSLQAPTAAPSGYCGSKCADRCGKAGIAKRCLTYCGICCQRCNCVPSGTYRNKSECPCYRDMLNSKGKPKCP